MRREREREKRERERETKTEREEVKRDRGERMGGVGREGARGSKKGESERK